MAALTVFWRELHLSYGIGMQDTGTEARVNWLWEALQSRLDPHSPRFGVDIMVKLQRLSAEMQGLKLFLL